MSNEEKSSQIGDAVLLLQRQRQELAHVEEKVERVKRAYCMFASESQRWVTDHAGGVSLAHPFAEERGLGQYLLSQSQLAALIAERRAAAEAVERTRAKLNGFGITV